MILQLWWYFDQTGDYIFLRNRENNQWISRWTANPPLIRKFFASAGKKIDTKDWPIQKPDGLNYLTKCPDFENPVAFTSGKRIEIIDNKHWQDRLKYWGIV
jgi:hypothetical protein